MISDTHLDVSTQEQIQELKRQQKATLPVGSNAEYGRFAAKINYLRHGTEYLYAWRKKNAERIKYERKCGIAYKVPRRVKPLTDVQRAAAREATKRHELKNPQRVIRQRIERTLLYLYSQCADGQLRKFKRYQRSEMLLGCPPDQFREHIREQLAKKGWLWSEWRVRWTMDHVVPVRMFKLPEEECACWHYTNLRPLAKHLNHRGHRN